MKQPLHGTMSKRLVPQLETAKEEIVSQTKEQDLSIEQEIECPRCHDFMTLCSEFDRLGYFCEECKFFAAFEPLKVWIIIFYQQEQAWSYPLQDPYYLRILDESERR